MSNDLIDIYDKDNKPLGRHATKQEAHKEGLWHRTSHIWIYNSKGEILLQLRAKGKDLFPDMWDVAVGGHISAGEEALTAAMRETKEELGLEIGQDDMEFAMIYKKELISGDFINREFYYAYLFRYDGSTSDLTLQADEVAGVDFFSIAKLEEELKSQPEKFVPHGDYWSKIINEIKKRTTI